MFDQFIFDAVVGQRPRGVEAEGPQISGQHFHGRDSARLDGLDELGAGREWEILPTPEAETLRIGEVVHCCRPRGGDIDHTGIRQLVLQAQARPALLRGLSVATLAFRAGGIGHRVAFVKEDHPVEIRPEPIDDLVDAGFLGPAFFRAKCGVSGEEDAFGERDVAALRKA